MEAAHLRTPEERGEIPGFPARGMAHAVDGCERRFLTPPEYGFRARLFPEHGHVIGPVHGTQT